MIRGASEEKKLRDAAEEAAVSGAQRVVKKAEGRGGGRRATRARCVSGATARTRMKAAAALAQVAIAAATAACPSSGTGRRCHQRRWFRLYRCCTRGAKLEMQMRSLFAVAKPCRPHGGVLCVTVQTRCSDAPGGCAAYVFM